VGALRQEAEHMLTHDNVEEESFWRLRYRRQEEEPIGLHHLDAVVQEFSLAVDVLDHLRAADQIVELVRVGQVLGLGNDVLDGHILVLDSLAEAALVNVQVRLRQLDALGCWVNTSYRTHAQPPQAFSEDPSPATHIKDLHPVEELRRIAHGTATELLLIL